MTPLNDFFGFTQTPFSRSISTDKHGTYLAVVNVGFESKENIQVTLPQTGKVTDATTDRAISVKNGRITFCMYPCQLRALRIQ